MAYLVRKTANINGQDTMLSAPDIECALHRTLTVREITDEAADAFNGMVRCLARDSKEPITLYIKGLTEEEKQILLCGCLMNYYKEKNN